MDSKLTRLLEILNLIEDDKARMSTFVDPSVFSKISDKERKEWYRKAAAAKNEYKQLYYSNRALGYDHITADSKAKDALKKEKRLSSEHDVFKRDEGEPESGFDKIPGEAGVAPERKEAVLGLIDGVKDKFKNNPDAQKVLSVNLIQHGFDEIIPPAKIPHYQEISKLMHKAEAEGKTKWKSTPMAFITGKPEDGGLGISQRTYYNVLNYLKAHAKSLKNEANEAFMTGLHALFGGSKNPSEFKLSNLEPMVDIIKRDIGNYKFKSYGLHLQGVTKEEGEDMLKDVPSIKHQYQGDALLIPLEPKTNMKSVLRKAIPGKKVILFGFDTSPKPLRKGWEGFPYKMVTNPTVIGSYSLSTESKSESLLIMLSEGFQCEHYDHSKLACGFAERPCDWKGFAGIGEDMKRECSDYR